VILLKDCFAVAMRPVEGHGPDALDRVARAAVATNAAGSAANIVDAASSSATTRHHRPLTTVRGVDILIEGNRIAKSVPIFRIPKARPSSTPRVTW